MNLPPSGSVVTFNRKPAGSYASEGKAYRVSYQRPARGGFRFDVHLENVATGTGTFDRAAMWERAVWSVVEAVA